MTDTLLRPRDLRTILTSRGPSALLADLIWAMGDGAEARAIYLRAWVEENDPAALVTLVTLEEVSSIPHPASPLTSRADSLVEAAKTGRLDPEHAAETIGFLVRLAAFRLHDLDEASRLWARTIAEVETPLLPFAELVVGDVENEVWQRAADSLMSNAEAAEVEHERAIRIVSSLMVSAELDVDSLHSAKRVLQISTRAPRDIRLFVVLRLLDQIDENPLAMAEYDGVSLLAELVASVEDDQERLSFRLRELEARQRSGAEDVALIGLEQLALSQAVLSRALILDRCQRAAVGSGQFTMASEMAEARAERVSDSGLRRALLLQAEEYARRAHAGASRLNTLSTRLSNFARRSGRPGGAASEHALRVREAVSLQTGSGDQLVSIWTEADKTDASGDTSLCRILYRRPDADLVPDGRAAAEILRRVTPSGSSMAARAAIALALVADDWDSLIQAATPRAFPSHLAHHVVRLKAYSLAFRNGRPGEALEVFRGLFDRGDHSPETLWGLWESARRAERLDEWRGVFAEQARTAERSSERSLFVALEAASDGAKGDLEGGLARVSQASTEHTRDAALTTVVARLAEKSGRPAPLDMTAAISVRALLQDDSVLSDLVDKADRMLEAGRRDDAARHFADAANRSTERPELASALFARAGTAMAGDRARGAQAEPYFRRALALQPGNGAAWRGFFTFLSRSGRHLEASELARRIPPALDDASLPVVDLRRSATGLAVNSPTKATPLLGALVRSASSRPVDGDCISDLDSLYSVSQRTKEVPAFRDLLEALLVDSPSTPYRGELNLRLGVLYAQDLRDVDLAVEHLRRAMNEAASRERAARRLRSLLEELERWEELVEMLLTSAEFVTDRPERVENLMTSAEILADRLRKPDASAKALELLLTHDSKHLPALLRLAGYYRTREDWDRVVSYLETAARLVEDKKERSQVYQQLGEVYQAHMDKPTLALENYLVSFMCNGANRDTFERLDRLYSSTRRHKELAGILNIAIETAKATPSQSPFNLEELLARRAHIEYKYLTDPRAAADSLLEALQINPSSDRYLRLIEAHLLEDADPETILKAYEVRGTALPPDSSDLLDILRAQAAVAERLPEGRERAIVYYRRLLEFDHSDRSALGRVEGHFRERKQWDQLIELYRNQLRWVRKSEETVSYYHKIARIYETQHRDLAAAADTYAQLLNVIPASISALRGLGRLYEAMRRWDDLIEVSEREVKLVDDDRVRAHLLFKIGSIYETHRNNVTQAISYYERAVDNDPRCVPALHGLRDIFQRRNQPDRVIEFLEREAMIWENPRERASIHARIAEVFWVSLKDADQAIEHLKKALQLVPDSGPALHRLLDIYYAQEAWADATPIAYSLSQHPESLQPDKRGQLFRRRGIIAYRLGNRREAIESLKIALDIEPDNSDSFELLSDILNEEGDADEHVEFFARLQRDFADRSDEQGLARVKRFLGRQAENRLDLREAVSAYSEAIALDPSSLAGLRDLVRVHIRDRSFADGLEATKSFTKGAPSAGISRSARVLGGALLMDHLDRRADARRAFELVLDEDAVHRQALFLGAQAAFLDEDWGSAQRMAESLVRLDGQNRDTVSRAERAEHLFYLGRILDVGTSELDEGLSYYARAREEYPVDPRPLKAAAIVLFRQQNWHRLDRLLDRALRGAASHGGDEATVPLLFFAAKLARLREHEDKAEVYLKRLLDLDATHSEARALLVEMVQSDDDTGSDAGKELSELLVSNVFDAAALHGLATVSLRQQNTDAASCYWRVLELIGDPRTKGPKPTPPAVLVGPVIQPIPRELIHSLVHPVALNSGYIRALVRLGPELARLGLTPPPSLPSRNLRLTTEERKTSVQGLLGEVYAALPSRMGDIICYHEGPRGTSLSTAVAERPSVVIEADFSMDAPKGRGEIRFLLANAAHLLSSGTYAILSAPRVDLTNLLWWMSRWRENLTAAPPDDGALWQGQLGPHLTRDLRVILADNDVPFTKITDPQHAHRFAVELEDAAHIDSDRMGLVICNDLEAAVGCILKIEMGVGLEYLKERPTELARSKRIVRLVQFGVSEAYFTLRGHLAPQ